MVAMTKTVVNISLHCLEFTVRFLRHNAKR